MKIKRIISSAMLAVMVFTMIIAAFPMAVSAAYSDVSVSSGTTATADLSKKQLETYLDQYIKYNYTTAEEMLEAEFAEGYLYSVNSSDGVYSLFINKYTGFVFYKNNVTGQILTSNPIDPNGNNASNELMSQISLTYFENAGNLTPNTFHSYKDSALRSQISVSPIMGGLRVNYIIGDTTPRYLVPGAVKAETFEEYILIPIIEAFAEKLEEFCEDFDTKTEFNFLENEDYVARNEYGYINTSGLKKYLGLKYFAQQMQKKCQEYLRAHPEKNSEYKSVSALVTAINQITSNFALYNPEADGEYENHILKRYPILEEGVAIYAYTKEDDETTKKQDGITIRTYCTEYSFSMMYANEKECGYVNQTKQKPVFRCSIEYSFNDDGSLSVSVPASSITFDATVYTLQKLSVLTYFGAANAYNDGYVFFPDGSGAVVDFSDFYSTEYNQRTNISISAQPYGKDFCYSTITGAHRQQVTMPVYGMVTEVAANDKTASLYGKTNVMNGFFAVVEEGSSLSTFFVTSGGASHKYATAYTEINPNPYDQFKYESQSSGSSEESGGRQSSYPKVSNAKYTGSFTTRYVMLTDEEVGVAAYGENKFYASDYVGMASYYKNLLKKNGSLATLQTVSSDLPLYIEVLGAMDITAKFLSFPITKTVPLTSFEDVLTMYKELSECKKIAGEKADEYKKLADETEDEAQKAEYLRQEAEYRELEATVENIKNINFRLTGFANGGVKYTYPAKLRWERACGGASGFEALIESAKTESAKADVNFGIFPDFDFMYINNTASFDGISNKGNVSKYVDNRYASKQIYDNILRKYDAFFDLVVSSNVFDKFYDKFEGKYSKFDYDKLSVSTLGSDLNSNFDEENPVNREEARNDIIALLDRMKNKDGYEIMTDVGNFYTIEYATHVLNMPIDSSHYRYASYAIPFIGLVLHGNVSYTGTPLNYSGNVEYEILKAIENGAAPYYILCYQNAAHLKEDEELNKYYGVSYQNWYTDMVETYTEINSAIGDLQDYELVYHTNVVCERIIEEEEMEKNYDILQNELLELIEAQITEFVDKAFDSLAEGGEANYDKRLKLVVDVDALMQQFSDILNIADLASADPEFYASVNQLVSKFTSEYTGASDPANTHEVTFSAIDYVSKYSYVTDSFAFDKDYVKTEYTIDNGNVTMVTYKKGNETVSFFLNYNSFTVNIRLDANTVIELEKFSYKRIG